MSETPYKWVLQVKTIREPKDSGTFGPTAIEVTLSHSRVTNLQARIEGDVAVVSAVGPEGVRSPEDLRPVREAEEAIAQLTFVSDVRSLTAFKELNADADADAARSGETEDLSGADLEGADLEDADLRGADLSDAYLEDADLRRADLTCADLRRADLEGADLEGADLRGAMLPEGGLPESARTDEETELPEE